MIRIRGVIIKYLGLLGVVWTGQSTLNKIYPTVPGAGLAQAV
jgi:hypothetical protein